MTRCFWKKSTARGWILMAFLASATTPGWAEQPAGERLSLPFGPGEELRYEIRWGLLKGGELTLGVATSEMLPPVDVPLDLAVGGTGPFWLFRGRAVSARWISLLYRVDDSIEGWVDTAELLPRYLEIHVEESGERGRRRVVYDHGAGVAHYHRHREFHRKRGPQSLDRLDPLESGAHDALSALYFLRRLPLASGDEVVLPVHENGKNRQVRVWAGAPETMHTPLGELEARPLRIQAQVEGKLASRKAMRLWIGTDSRRLPVRFEIDLAWGDLKGLLLEHRPAE